MKLRILGAHSMQTRSTHQVALLVGESVALDAGSLAAGLTLEEQLRVQSILLTHRHLDHIKDVPLLALNTLEHPGTYRVYGLSDTLAHLEHYLLDGALYPRFTERPALHNPKVRLCPVEPLVPFEVQGCRAMAVPMPHGVPAVGYRMAAPDGACLFYTGDTGGGLAQAWPHIRPDLLVVEVTLPNGFEAQAVEQGHLTPALLARELANVRALGFPLPRVCALHLNPWHEAEIRGELATVAEALGTEVAVATEDMALEVRASLAAPRR